MRKILIVLLTTAIVIVPMQAAEAKAPYAVSAAPSAAALTYGGTAAVGGSVSPKAKKKKVYVQQLVAGTWHNIASTKTNKKSKYAVTFTPRLGPQVYRVFKPKGSKAAGASAPFWITASRWINVTDLGPQSLPVGNNLQFGPAVIGFFHPYTYENSMSIRSVGGDGTEARVNLAGRGCTQLDTYIGIRNSEHSSTTATAYVYTSAPGADIYNIDGSVEFGQSARRVRAPIAAAATSLNFYAASSKTPANPANETYVTYASPMLYCAS